MMRIAINGFGRIGRNFLRAVLQDTQASKKLNVVAINIGPSDAACMAHLFKYDSLLGAFSGTITHEKVKEQCNNSETACPMRCDIHDHFIIDGKRIIVLQEKHPARAPWKQLNIDWVVESSGLFTKREKASGHIKAGAQKVLITAPAHDSDVTIIPGVNDALFDTKKHTIISLGSCTTNAIVPVLHVLHNTFTIINGSMTTIHAYTNGQALLDVDMEGDLRRSRAAAINIIPTSTGAEKTIALIMPALKDKMTYTSVRVPTAKVSLIDVTLQVQKNPTQESVSSALIQASQAQLKDVMSVSKEPLVSSDYSGSPYSVIIDNLLTSARGNVIKVFGWYDNEWGYSMRLKDFLTSVTR